MNYKFTAKQVEDITYANQQSLQESGLLAEVQTRHLPNENEKLYKAQQQATIIITCFRILKKNKKDNIIIICLRILKKNAEVKDKNATRYQVRCLKIFIC